MERYQRITSVTFGQTVLRLPLSVRVSRRAEPRPARNDSDEFATSVQLGEPTIAAEVRIRGTAAAEGLSLGQSGDLSFTVAPTGDAHPSRTITLTGAVLAAIELSYEQVSMATATLRFVAEAQSGNTDPFAAEEDQ